jgi:hypothetical protein
MLTTGDKWIKCNKLFTNGLQVSGRGFDYEREVLGENNRLKCRQAEAKPEHSDLPTCSSG